MEVHAGEGGEDSRLFIYDLMAAYVKYAKRLGFKSEIIASEPSFCSFIVNGKGSFTYFENEIGKHCVQRVPPTEGNGRVHTSIVSVSVLPISNSSQIELNEDDFEIQLTKGSGAGGQGRNKVETAVRAIHKPTGLKVFVCNERSQHQNKDVALSILSSKVESHYAEKNQQKIDKDRLAQLGNRGRGSKVRTYNFFRSRVTDHRSNVKTTRIDKVMNGEFDLLW